MAMSERGRKIRSYAVMLLVLLGLAALIYGLSLELSQRFAQNQEEAQKRIPGMVLPEGETFTSYEGEDLLEEVSALYIADNGAGIAAVMDRETTHGMMRVMVGINEAGRITAVSILSQEYTEGSEEGVSDPAYLGVYVGRTVLTALDISLDYEIDAVPGAEEASDAVYQAVRIALLQNRILVSKGDVSPLQNTSEGE